MKRIGYILALSVVLVSVSVAQGVWSMDRAHSSVQFSIKHMVISTVTGTFKDFSIDLKSSKANFTDASASAVIKTGSISTENDMRDNHLKSDDFFNAAKYPEIKFQSVEFKKTGENTYQIVGDLTIRDVTKRVTFNAVLGGTLKTDHGTLAAWSATTTVNRFDYNLKWNKAIESGGLMVGKDVTVTLNLEFTKK